MGGMGSTQAKPRTRVHDDEDNDDGYTGQIFCAAPPRSVPPAPASPSMMSGFGYNDNSNTSVFTDILSFIDIYDASSSVTMISKNEVSYSKVKLFEAVERGDVRSMSAMMKPMVRLAWYKNSLPTFFTTLIIFQLVQENGCGPSMK